MQSLNQKATAREYARNHSKRYEDLNLIVVHLGGGTSVVAHKHGRMVDANNGLDGDGPFATNRSGALPVGDLIDLCYSGKYTHAEMRRKATGAGGLVAYLGENDVRAIEKRALDGDSRFEEVLNAMTYQIAKEIGSAAAVLCGKVDAILLTGGIAHAKTIVEKLREYVSFIAPIEVYAGEFEIASMGRMAFEALSGRQPIKEL
jgi:butyrate kinase